MKAIRYHRYGSYDGLKLEEITKPVPDDDGVLVAVCAASVNSWDVDLVMGKPFLFRVFSGLLTPRNKILGADIAGRVEVVGKNVTRFRPGDEVYGDISARWGGFAEFVCVPEKLLVVKPPGLKFDEAAAIPQAATLAWQALTRARHVRKGDKILINGAGGGVGTFALQMAKFLGAYVTTVDHRAKSDLLIELGSDRVLDYTKEDFTKTDERYDLIIDVVATHSVFAYERLLRPDGIFIMVGGTLPRIIEMAFIGGLLSAVKKKRLGLLIHKANEDLNIIADLFASGKIRSIIDKRFPLHDTSRAVRYVGEGYAKGKVIIIISDF